jgi:hypothetical protein
MIEAGATSTEEVKLALREVPAPPGIGMVAPPTLLRKAEGAQSEGRAGGGRPSTPVQRGQQYKHYKGRSPKAPTRAFRGAAVGATLQRLPPRRLLLCGPSLTSSPDGFPRQAW